MSNLLQFLSTASKQVNESLFGVHFRAVGPDGIWKNIDAESGEPLKTMQIIYNSVDEDVQTGAEVIVRTPNVTISNRCLNPFPSPGEHWVFEVPENPMPGASMKQYAMSRDREYREDVLGVTTIYLIEMAQSE